MIHIHPFPARMAPEVALGGLQRLPKNYLVLDPMSGSGMVLETAAKLGLKAVGYDLDPLACMISKVNGTKINEEKVRAACLDLVSKCNQLDVSTVALPWIDGDKETQQYIQFWFAPKQIKQLRKLSFYMVKEPLTTESAIINILKIATSRLIITKEPKASLARDAAHSRPHRTITANEFDVLAELPRSLEHVLKALAPDSIQKNVSVYRGDARKMGRIASDSVDCVVTSPPYLNAIDYMRGHKLSLVWFGHSVSKLKRIRSRSVGTEANGLKRENSALLEFFENLHPSVDQKKRAVLRHYYRDLCSITDEVYRVLKPKRKVTYVIGNSRVRGHEIKNSELLISAARQSGFNLVRCFVREIPENRRYMPLLNSRKSALSQRMKKESVYIFVKP